MNRSKPRNRKDKKKRNWWILTPLIILLILIVSIGSYAAYVFFGVKNNIDGKMYESVSAIDSNLTQKKLSDRENLNILLLGIDAESEESGRSDAMMVMSLKPENDEMTLISIPRDTRTTIIGRGTEDKINHAFAFGGPDMAIETVENFLDIDLDFFVRINMEGLEELVNELGTITINNELDFNQGGHHFPIGPIELNGDMTMNYVRMRKQDPDGDFGRTERQRKVIEGIINEGATISNATRIVEFTDILGNNMGTNLEFNDMLTLLQHYRNTRRNFESYQIQGSGTMINNVYYYIVPDQEIVKVREMIES
ncbi:LCP family protein [Amphibacillus cookii]|uniref:LCP family glycopolymer transferase n=1 Tax=Amphibacillus cookii TaxID=767787 RepID=UPI00195D32B9|nr:LCP family protein [Amphibacillus cookii]MBM7539935.1 LCP family protein required for cell wall assembly [Amphibacillus cookii]